MTLACEDVYSKLVEVVTVADVSDEDLAEVRFVHAVTAGRRLQCTMCSL